VTESTHSLQLTSGRLLAKNTLWNLAGGAPVVLAVFSIPILIRDLGKDRFGVLALAWALVGYASFFDVGLGRALTQLVARKLGAGEREEIPALVWTSLLLMLALGTLGCIAVAGISPWLVSHELKIPESIQTESLRAFYLLALSIPAVICSAALRGLLEAHQRFMLASALRIPLSSFTFVGPLMVLPFSHRLVPVVAALVAGRYVGLLAHFGVCVRVVPELRRISWHTPSALPLLRFGGWMTVSNVIGPLMITLDRFFIAAIVSVTAVAYYATPYELVTKLLLVSIAVVGVLFPAFAVSFASDGQRAAMLYGQTLKLLFLVLFPIVLLAIVLAKEGLMLWLGADFAQHSTRVVQWLAIGVLANSVALVPFSFVQGIGRPDLTAKLHLLELPVYLGVLYWLILVAGIEGAAIAWTGRTVFDSLALFLIAGRFLPSKPRSATRTKMLATAATATLFLAALPHDPVTKMAFLFATILVFVSVTWFLILTPEERSFAKVSRVYR
jgi:O-antigen/teichoic acid export membrane protein